MQNAKSLAEVFRQAYTWYCELESENRDTRDEKVQNKVHDTLLAFEQCQELVVREAVFSPNELKSDMTVEQLQYTTIEYYMAVLIQKVTTDHTQPLLRINLLTRADELYTAFLSRCEEYHIVSSNENETHLRQLEDKMDAETLRECKLDRFKRERAAKQRIQDLMARQGPKESDEYDENLREQILVSLELALIGSFNDQLAIRNERDMLKQISEMDQRPTRDGPDHPSSQRKGIEVTHISSTMEMRRETIQSQVFQPGYRLPTMSLEEFADQELKDALERQEREKNAPEAPKRYDQLEEAGLEDDDKLVDEAIYRDRSWDNWKDANPRGAGNKKWSQF